MASFLQVENLTKSFGDKVLLDSITFGVFEGDKIGLIAKNGTGKTTLLRIIAGSESHDSGNVVFRNDLRIGYLEQLPNFDINLSVIETCLYSDDEASQILRRYEKALANNEDITDLIPLMDSADAWDYEDRFKQILSQLKISDYNQPIKQLSGGQVKRVALARVLINKPEFLILDEPTNHLDIDMIEWLEGYLSRNRITLLMVTHDRYFLDNVCNKIIEIDQQLIYSYAGNYNYYIEKRAERIDAQNAEVSKAKNLLRTELDWMRRQPQARATKAKYRIDAFYDLEKKSKVSRDDSSVELSIKSSYIGSKIFEAKHISKKFDSKIILDDFNYIFARYEKLGIVGNNGVGKSTFIKLLLGDVEPDNGAFDIGETVSFGYYSQDGLQFDESKKVLDMMQDIAEVIVFDEKTRYTASQFLQLFLFSPSDQQKYISKLSGGEKRRLYLATILMRKPNFLILDEPTNDLDIITLEILEDYIEKFKGCVIIISHDRFFMDRTVDHLFVFEGDGKIKDFPGNYSDFREWRTLKDKEIAEIEKQKTQSIEKTKTIQTKTVNKLSFKERKELETLAVDLKSLELEKSEIEELFNSGRTDIPNITEKSIRISAIIALIDEKELRWLELSEKEQ
ncbi:MAG: ABC-F family ATP-binding cassette domain-containing protein [Muribaculaceae bacterium]